MIGESGAVHALDIHPLALKKVKTLAARKQLTNVRTIHSDGPTGLPDSSIDVALLYDVLHTLSQPQAVLAELHRVLKPNGTLSVTPEHLSKNESISLLTDHGLFKLARKSQGL